jgi:hypothetical protein
MRKPRDFDSELKALGDKQKQLKERKLHQLGELVIATGADGLSVEQLAGLLLTGVANKDAAAKESWSKRGTAFFQRASDTADNARGNQGGTTAGDSSATRPRAQTGTN